MLITDIDTFAESITEGNIYYFSSSHLATDIPHFFICLKKNDGGLIYMSCCTSQFEKRRQFIELRNLPLETLVYLPQNGNPFSKDTFVDCNNVFLYNIEDLKKKISSGNLYFKGKILESQYHQILTGIHASPLVEEEIKELIPIL